RRRRNGRLESLVGGRLGLRDELLDGADALAGRVDRLDRETHVVQQRAQVGGPVVQALSGEEGLGIVDGAVDLEAGSKPVVGRRHHLRRVLQSEQVLTYGGGESDITHNVFPSWKCSMQLFLSSREACNGMC